MSKRRRYRLGAAERTSFQIEKLERRLLLSTAPISFGSEQTFAAGPNPRAVLADVNGDGKADLVVADYGSLNVPGGISVLLGNGNGTFQPAKTYATIAYPTSVTVADVNGDGKPDLIVTSDGAVFTNTSGVSVLLGNGDGTFQPAKTFAVPKYPSAVAITDINGDNKPDLLVADSAAVCVLLGNGDGTFAPQQTFSTGPFTSPDSIAVADFNGDGKTDVAVAGFDSYDVIVLLGNGNGTFGAPQSFAVGGRPKSIVAADLNNDNRTDLVVANSVPGTVSVLLGNGNGTFQPQRAFFAGSSPEALRVTDMNGDGIPDIVVASYDAIDVLPGTGTGWFLPRQSFAIGPGVASLDVGDLNGDGLTDVVVSHSITNTVGVDLNLGVEPQVISINRTSPVGPITSASSVTFTVTFNKPVTGVSLADFAEVTGGSLVFSTLSISALSTSVYTVTVSGITGTGTLGLNLVDNGTIHDLHGQRLRGGQFGFQAQQTFATGLYATGIAVADVDGDGRPDIASSYYYSGSGLTLGGVTVFLGQANGAFKPSFVYSSQKVVSDPVFADLNGDGKPDLILAGYNEILVLLGNGNGAFHLNQTIAASGVNQILVADLDGDGKPDLLFEYNDVIRAMIGTGVGSFLPGQTFAAGAGFMAVGDVNGDGIPDVVAVFQGTKSLDLMLGNGNGTFHAPQTLASGYFGTAAIADVNGDGKPDLVVENYPGSISVLVGNGNGTFAAPQSVAATTSAQPLTVVDLNGDGNPDIVVPNPSQGTVSVFKGNGDGTFGAAQTFATGGGAVVTADFNGDGVPDLAVQDLSTVSILLGQFNDNFTGQVYTVVSFSDTINGTVAADQITLTLDSDAQHIDWTLNGGPVSQMAINDPNGLTINGNGSTDVITLDYADGKPLPDTIHLNGTFMIDNLAGTNPLAGTTLDIGRSTVFISYSSSDPIAAIQGYLKAGYNAGAWNGSPTASTGVITSTAAQANPNHNTAIGYADSADGQGINTTPNTIELSYTLDGDANLDHQVNSADLQILLFNLNRPGSWDQGDFNYDAQVNSADLQALLFTLNTSLGSQAAPMAIAATPATTTTATSSGSDPSQHLMPAISPTGSATTPTHHPHAAKVAARKRR
jgi:hypothetical protein